MTIGGNGAMDEWPFFPGLETTGGLRFVRYTPRRNS
jgi:hypothetical protein